MVATIFLFFYTEKEKREEGKRQEMGGKNLGFFFHPEGKMREKEERENQTRVKFFWVFSDLNVFEKI